MPVDDRDHGYGVRVGDDLVVTIRIVGPFIDNLPATTLSWVCLRENEEAGENPARSRHCIGQ
jgi:hypothetical protein